jgi:hypothetical protein
MGRQVFALPQKGRGVRAQLLPYKVPGRVQPRTPSCPETFRRAPEGRDPAIIFGCSATDQVVTNIDRAMNSVLAENRSGEHFSRARGWEQGSPASG